MKQLSAFWVFFSFTAFVSFLPGPAFPGPETVEIITPEWEGQPHNDRPRNRAENRVARISY